MYCFCCSPGRYTPILINDDKRVAYDSKKYPWLLAVYRYGMVCVYPWATLPCLWRSKHTAL